MSTFSPALRRHVDAQAPVLAGATVDYPALLARELSPIDFYDSRRHLGVLSGAQLAVGVRIRAAALTARGVRRGDRLVMVATNTGEYLMTLLAALLLGAVPCAVAPPPAPTRGDSAGVRHLRAAVDVVDPALVLTTAAVALDHPGLVRYTDLDRTDPGPLPQRRAAEPVDPHHIQLTSGSISAPKAVVLSHGNVAHNIAAIGSAMATVAGRDRVFSWLPMYHDMGFIQVLAGLVYSDPVALMTPLGFLRDPLSWARNMTHHRSTVTAGPAFGYRAAADALARTAGPLDGIDLTRVRYAYVGAEPIARSTLTAFAESFAPLGFRAEALVPSYGMAESVLASTLACRGGVRVLQSDDAGYPGPPLVSCGRPVDGMRVRVVDAGGAVGDGVIGDIRISGPSVMAGYLGPDGRLIRPPGGWHDTGDRGLLSGGELFVVGRSKEMLIVRGRNLPPYDVEQVIGTLPQVGAGYAVVFAVPDDGRGRESVVAVVAATATDPEQRRQLQRDVTAVVREAFGFSLDDVVVVPRRAIDRTTSGKIQRLRIRDRYLGGPRSGAAGAVRSAGA